MDNTCICCGRIIPEGRHICLACERGNDMQNFKCLIRTNGDKIRAMNDCELAELLCCVRECLTIFPCTNCPVYQIGLSESLCDMGSYDEICAALGKRVKE